MHLRPIPPPPGPDVTSLRPKPQSIKIVPYPDPASQAKILLSKLAAGCESPWDFGPFTVSLYDTAWLAMLIKPGFEGELSWLFPESFDLLVREQKEDGSWDSHACLFDGIINGLAGLLCLARHRDAPITSPLHPLQVARRVTKAKMSLNKSLQAWAVEDTPHVGFEMIIPALLRQLEKHDITFTFPAKSRLMAISKQKLGTANVKNILHNIPTLAHSLEALVGFIDFDEAARYKTNGSMLGSPSATAAYLMFASAWDDEAEAYLRSAVKNTGAAGGVPSVFPSPVFQISWTFTTLLRNGFFKDDPTNKDLTRVADFFASNLKQHNGIAGFAPGLVADVDDTSRSILAVHQNGRSVDLRPLVDTFAVKTHFKTYSSERNPSYGANCNVLLALLSSPEPDAQNDQIEKVASFLCSAWEQGNATDKWNHSELYLDMLIAEALVKLMEQVNEGKLTGLPRSLLFVDIPLVLSQILGSVALSQLENGSWNDSVENTSYAVLTLKYISQLPWSTYPKLASLALCQGRAFLYSNPGRWSEAPYAWVGKVSYGSPLLSEAYCLAAVHQGISKSVWVPEIAEQFRLSDHSVKKVTSLLLRTPLLKNYSLDHVEIIMAESVFYCKRLQANALNVFPALNSHETKYLDFIPFTWIVYNRIHRSPLTSAAVWQMILIGVLVFQADEYMETYLPQLTSPVLELLKSVLRERCNLTIEEKTPETEIHATSLPAKSSKTTLKAEANFTQVLVAAQNLIAFVRDNQHIQSASSNARNLLAFELSKFLVGHIDHVLDSRRMADQVPTNLEAIHSQYSQIKEYPAPLGTFFGWVQCTGSASGGVPLSLAFYCCLLSPSSHDDEKEYQNQQLATGRSLYLRQAISQHLAASCRLMNDYGSLDRDVAESNVNSLNFVELRPTSTTKSDSSQVKGREEEAQAVGDETKKAKQTLLDLADFEDSCVDEAVQKLKDTSLGLNPSVLQAVDVFVAAVQLWGQMYVLKDLSNPVKRSESS